ncbi:hypothetical protein CTM88_09825 [Photobacterium aquimaris]|uniref:RiboL-PSP-HEPN domain-containing protein n=1 Tax=Photobacterium aquimaris TaxID=512643 RepID=A0A2T3IKN3_9GAMM|nr:hypothetical protein [Photobacterium aquimaris]OBU13993.1 hypothetical protein AYY20_08765 [Photobacterium aquimaris]PSU28913.1 hypothetical protein CTM88_09825 [Photobacterium aquimaris]
MNNSVPKIATRFKNHQKEIRDIWESFCIIEFYMPKVQECIKDDILPPLNVDLLFDSVIKTNSKGDTYGALHSLSVKSNYRRTLLESVLTFEDYISDLIEIVYLDYPQKLSVKDNDDSSVSGYQKLLKVILDSGSKDEIIDKVVEEKIRGIFYGNPLDVFEKDKAKLEFGTFFKDNCKEELKLFKSIIALRNIVAHNNGKVDRKYIREADKNATLGQTVQIERQFLKDAIYNLSLLSTYATSLVLENIYKTTAQGRLARQKSLFDRR